MSSSSSSSPPPSASSSSSEFDTTKFFELVDKHQDKFIQQLREVVAIQSVSSQLPSSLPEIEKMISWVETFIRDEIMVMVDNTMKVDVRKVPNPASTPERQLPSILLAEFIVDPSLKTVCCYGHLDVQPASQDEDGWDTDPWVLTEVNNKLYGRGSTDDKGPALSWLWVIWLYTTKYNLHTKTQQKLTLLPVNVKLLFEGMEEYGSEGLFELITNESSNSNSNNNNNNDRDVDGFLSDVDFFCISDNYWLGRTKPCITYGLRGVAYFEIAIVDGLGKDLHSGVLGGTVHEPLNDLVAIMATLVSPTDGKILIDGIYDTVRPVTPEEESLYETLDFNLEEYMDENQILCRTLLHQTKKDVLMGRWRYPTLSLHGIEGAFSGPGAKTVIPANVKGKFSLRLVPDQEPAEIDRLVRKHLEVCLYIYIYIYTFCYRMHLYFCTGYKQTVLFLFLLFYGLFAFKITSWFACSWFSFHFFFLISLSNQLHPKKKTSRLNSRS